MTLPCVLAMGEVHRTSLQKKSKSGFNRGDPVGGGVGVGGEGREGGGHVSTHIHTPCLVRSHDNVCIGRIYALTRFLCKI